MNKKCNVVLLPQNKKGWDKGEIITLSPTELDIAKADSSSGLYNTVAPDNFVYQAQHLYFCSDDEIKEGDWFINIITNRIFGPATYADVENRRDGKDYMVKVVASTDSSLGLPLIPQSFLQEYVRSNGNIKEVWLEQQRWAKESKEGGGYLHKANPDDTVEAVYSNGPKTMQEAIKQGYSDVTLLKFTENNEVIVVPKEPEFETISIGEQVVKIQIHPIDYTVDQELEDAAKKAYPDHPLMSTVFPARKGYITGYKVAQKQNEQDAIEFAEWIEIEKWVRMFGGIWRKMDERFSTVELYKLYEQSKIK